MANVRDGNAVPAARAAILRHNDGEQQPDLLAVRAKVHPDGAEAQLTVHTSLGSLAVNVGHDVASAVLAEVQTATMLMLYRQTMRPDDGITAFDDVLATALRPDECHVMVDSRTGERLFVLQFRDRLPLAIRMTPEQVGDSLAQLGQVSRRTAN